MSLFIPRILQNFEEQSENQLFLKGIPYLSNSYTAKN